MSYGRTTTAGDAQPNLNWILLAIALAALIPRIYLGLVQFVAYDGYWHVFTATQDRWENLVLEYKADAHPILYYILLRWVAHLGHLPIVYRSISILPGAAAAFAVGKIAQQVCTNRVVPLLAAGAYAFAITSIDLSIEVRSYMGCLFFVLLSFDSFLRALTLPEGRRLALHWILFTVFASVAISFEYYAIFYLAACLGVVSLAVGLDSDYRARFFRRIQPALPPFVIAVLIPVLTITYFYRTHLSRQPRIFPHVGSFYWNPGSGESRIEFLLKNLQNAFAYFMPLPIENRAVFLGILAVLVLLLVTVAFRERSVGNGLPRLAVFFMPILLVAQLMALGLARRYPFGGEMRQQSILAPFLCLSLFLLLDRLVSIPSSPRLRWVALAVTAIAIAASADFQWRNYPRMAREIASDDYRDFLALAPAPDAVYLDQLSLIGYYIHTHDWTWRSGRRQQWYEQIEEFRTSGPGGRNIDILRNRTAWNLDFNNPSTYREISQLMRDYHKPSISVFNLHQDGPALPLESWHQRLEGVEGLADQADLKVTALHVEGTHFFATFKPK